MRPTLILSVFSVVALSGRGSAPSAACADERDTITQEYTTNGVNMTPKCTDYTQAASSEYFTYAELSVHNPHGWSLIRLPLTIAKSNGYGLDKWRQSYGSARTMTSAYRCPHHNSEVGGAAQSRHMYGDAADLANVAQSQAEYDAMFAAATTAKADYIEPTSGPCGMDCVHADWRNHTGGLSPSLLTATREAQISADLVESLDTQDDKARMDAFYKLLAAAGLPGPPTATAATQRLLNQNPGLAPRLRAVLIGNLTRENSKVHAATGPKQFTEEYVTYYGDLIGAVAATHDVQAVSALVGAIDTGAMAAEGLAALGPAAVSAVVAQMTEQKESRRQSAAVVLGLLAANDAVRKDPASIVAIRNALLRAQADSSSHVRKAASDSMLRLNR